MEKLALKKPEACEILGISLGSLNKLIHEKKLRPIQIGVRGVRISLADIQRFLNGEK